MAALYGCGTGGGCNSSSSSVRRGRRSSLWTPNTSVAAVAAVEEEEQHNGHYMEDPDLDIKSIVTEFVPFDDPFVPYFDAASGEEMEGDLCAPLEASFASSIGEERMYARFRPPPAGYPPNTSTPRFTGPPAPLCAYEGERVEVVRGQSGDGRTRLLDDTLAELMDASDVRAGGGGGGRNNSPTLLQQLDEPQQLSPSAAPAAAAPVPLFHESALSLLDEFMHSISRLVADPGYARTTNCFRSKIPREVPVEALVSFLTHCVRYPMRRPATTLLQARADPTVLDQLLKTAMEPLAEPHELGLPRDSYFRITLKNTVHSLAHLNQIVRNVSLAHRGYVDVTYSPVRGRLAFLGFNGNLPIRMSQPIASFVEAEHDARQHLNALFSAEITLSRADDDAREVFITYFDALQTHPRTGQQARVTEVNVYHIIHRAPSSSTTTTSAPRAAASPVRPLLMGSPQQQPMSMSYSSPPPSSTPSSLSSSAFRPGTGNVIFTAASPKYHEVPVERPMMSLAHMMERTFSLADCFQLARSFPQHKW